MISIAFLIIGCSLDETQVEWYPEDVCDTSFNTNRLPLFKDKIYDLNADGIDDIQISQFADSIDGQPEGSRLLSSISALGQNLILVSARRVFVDEGYILHTSSPELFWSPGQLALMKVSGCNGLYKDKWSKVSRIGPFHGLIIRNEEREQMAWLKLEVNSASGEVELVDYSFSDGPGIVVGEH